MLLLKKENPLNSLKPNLEPNPRYEWQSITLNITSYHPLNSPLLTMCSKYTTEPKSTWCRIYKYFRVRLLREKHEWICCTLFLFYFVLPQNELIQPWPHIRFNITVFDKLETRGGSVYIFVFLFWILFCVVL